MSYRKCRDLKDRLDWADLRLNIPSKHERKGSYPWRNCCNSKTMVKCRSFVNPRTGKTHHIKSNITYQSEYVYILQCLCGLLYVGKTTQECRNPINQHKYTIRKKMVELPVHLFFKPHTQHSTIQIYYRWWSWTTVNRKIGGSKLKKIYELIML